jgi:cytochrome P450
MSAIKPLLDLAARALDCPYPYYAQLRQGPAVAYDADHNIYIVSHYADVININTRPQVFSNRNPMGPAITAALERLGRVLATRPASFQERAMTVLRRGDVLFTADPPEHSRHRKILNKALTPTAIRGIEPRITAHCAGLLAGIAVDTATDLLPAFAIPAPVYALASLLGVPIDRAADFFRWAGAINATIGTALDDDALLAAIEAQMEFWSYFEAQIEQRRMAPRDDLISAVTQARGDDGQPLTLNEMVGICSQLVGAGADTTTKLIANTAYRVCLDLPLQSRLRADPALLPACLEEMLRLEPPVQGMFRVATQDFKLAEQVIPAGALVWSLYASANRDEAVFCRPDEIKLERENLRAHLSFGHGPHICIGASLARSVARIAIDALLRRFDSIELAQADFVPSYEPSYIMRGMKALPVRASGPRRA